MSYNYADYIDWRLVRSDEPPVPCGDGPLEMPLYEASMSKHPMCSEEQVRLSVLMMDDMV
jgi:hypothetical protein